MPRGGAIALVAVPVLAIVVVAAMGLSSAINPLLGRPANASASARDASALGGPDSSGVLAGQERGISGAAGSSNAERDAQMPVASSAGSSQPNAQTGTGPNGELGAVAAALSPEPPPEMLPIEEPAAGTAGVAVASLAGAAAGSSSPRSRGTITIETFGYGFGEPADGFKYVADVRNIDVSGFTQAETGLMPSVRDRVMAVSTAQEWLGILRTGWIPSLKDGDKVAIGCARGHHRSVTLAVILAEDLRARGYTVNLVHRDILKTW